MSGRTIQQGAEAVLIRRSGNLRPVNSKKSKMEFPVRKDDLVLKRRVKKGYRIKEMDDAIRKRRTRREGKLLEKSGKLISVPKVLKVDEKTGEIDMEFIEGKKLSESLDELKNWKEVCAIIGKNIANLHDEDIIHGDLTTSNMILKDKEVYFIDFGLGFGNGRVEDKAVDLHLIKQALEAKHFKRFDEYFEAVLKGYEISKDCSKVMKQFEKVEKRGRYKAQY